MRISRFLSSTTICGAVVALAGSALAQGTAPAAPAPAAPAAAPAPAPAPAEAAAPEAAAAEPAPEQAGQAMPAEHVEAPDTAAEPAADAMEEHAKSPAPEIGGHVEAAYHLNLSEPHAETAVPLRSYDAAGGNSFLLHTAHLVVKHSFTDAVSAVIELDAGTDGAAANAGTSLIDIQEAYATYKSDFGLSLTAGKFVTYQGIEVIEGPMNPTLTRGFLFGLAEPFGHIGAKVHYAIGETADIGVGVVNGWDVGSTLAAPMDNNDDKTIIFRVGVTPSDMFWAGLSGTFGSERATEDPSTTSRAEGDKRWSLDLTGAVIPSDMFTINFQGNLGSEKDAAVDPAGNLVDGSWFGFGLQPVITSGGFKGGLRFEYFADSDGTRTGAPGTDINVWNLTLTPGYVIDDALGFRAEFRFDKANEPVFNGEDSQATIGVGAHYMF